MSMGGSAPAGASTNQPRAGASVYTPTNQGNVDIALQSLFGGLGSPYITGGFGGQGLNVNPSLTPAGVAYTGAQPWIGASGGGVADPNDPFYQLALKSANDPAWTSGALNTVAGNIYSGLDPALAQATAATQPAIGGLESAIQYGVGSGIPQAIANAQGLQGDIASLRSGVSSLFGSTLPQAEDASSRLFGAGSSILDTGFDPQQALYNRTQNQVAQQAAAAAAQAGLGASAYGASEVGNTLSNFNINWQNQQLQRQAEAEQAARGAFTTAAGLPGGVLQQGGQIDQQIAALSQAAGALPADLAARLGQLGIQAGGLAYSPLQGYSGLAGTLAPFAQQGATIGGLPYNVQTGGTSAALQALGSGANLGTQQYVLPQQLANDLQSYLGLGQAASSLSGYLGNLGLQQQQNAFSGLGGALGMGANLLGNPFTSASSSGLLGGTLGNPFSATSGGLLGGAFAGGGGAFAPGSANALMGLAGGPLADIGGGGAALGVPDAALGLNVAAGAGLDTAAAGGGGLGKLGAAAPVAAVFP